MKKFTLEFINQNMEEDFRYNRLINVQKPIYTCLVVTALLYSVFGSIQTSIQADVKQAKLTLFITSVLIVQCFFAVRYPQTIWLNQILSLYLSILTQLDIATASTTYDYYLYGANVQLWQTCLLTLSEFKHSVHLVFSTIIVKLSIPLYQGTSDYREILGSIACAIIFLVMNYLNNKMARSQYLLTKKELRWQQYMPSIIEKPYFVFEYNNTQRCFSSIEQQLFNFLQLEYSHDYTLRQFLRKAHIENITLEQYLFRHYLASHTEESTLEAIYEKQLIKLKLYDLNIKNNQYLLIINTPEDQKFQQAVHHQNMLQYARFIKVNTKISKLPFNAILKMKTQIMNNLFLSSSVVTHTYIGKVNLQRVICKLSSMYRLGYQMNISIVSDQDIYLNTFKEQLFAFLNYLFLLFQQSYSDQENNIKLIIESSELEVVSLRISVVNIKKIYETYQRSEMLKQLEPNLLLSPLSNDLELKFIRDMQQSYEYPSLKI